MHDFILLFGLIIITDRKVKISNFSVDFLVSVHLKGNGIILLGIFLSILKIWVPTRQRTSLATALKI